MNSIIWKSSYRIRKLLFGPIALLAPFFLVGGCVDLSSPPEERVLAQPTPTLAVDPWVEDQLAPRRAEFRTDRKPGRKPAPVDDPAELLNRLDRRIADLGTFLQGDPDAEELDRLMEDLRKGISTVRQVRDNNRMGAYYVGLAMIRREAGYPTAAESACEQVALLLEGQNDSVWPAAARQLRGEVCLDQGKTPEALAHFEMAFELAADRSDWPRAHRSLAAARGLLHERAADSTLLEVAPAPGNGVSEPKASALAFYRQAEMRAAEGKVGEAVESASKAMEQFEEAGLRTWQAAVAFRRAEFLAGETDLDLEATFRAVEEAAELSESAGDHRTASALYLQAGALLEREWNSENILGAEDRYRRAYKIARDRDLDALEVESLDYLALAFRNRENPNLALACLLEAESRLAEMADDDALRSRLERTTGKIRESFPDVTQYNAARESVKGKKDALLRQATGYRQQ